MEILLKSEHYQSGDNIICVNNIKQKNVKESIGDISSTENHMSYVK